MLNLRGYGLALSMAVLIVPLVCSCAQATNVTITITHVFQMDGDLFDPGNLDPPPIFSWADFAPDISVGATPWPGTSEAMHNLSIGDTRDAFPTNWSHTFSVSGNPTSVSVTVRDDDHGNPWGPSFDWAGVKVSSDNYYYLWFNLDTTTGQITATPDGHPTLPTVLSGTPENRQYFTMAPSGSQEGAEMWFTIQIQDEVPPDFTLTADPSGWTQSSTVSASGANDLLTGFDRLEFYQNSVLKYTDYTPSASHVDTQQGGNTWLVKCYDKAGNHNDKTVNTYIDTSQPYEFSMWADPTGYIHNGPVIDFSGGGDALSPFAFFQVYLDGNYLSTKYTTSGSFAISTTEGTHTVTMTEYDAAANNRSKSLTIYVDNTPPTGSTPVENPTTWTTGNVIFTFSATDALSGMDHYEAALDGGAYTTVTSPYTVSAEWQHAVHIRALDRAGNIKQWDLTSYIDRTAPTSPNFVINHGDAYAASTAVAVGPDWFQDAGSGLDTMRFSNDNVGWSSWEALQTPRAWNLAAGDGLKTVWMQARDMVGNTLTCADSIYLVTQGPVPTVGSPTPGETDKGPVDFPVEFNWPVTGFASPSDITVVTTGLVSVGSWTITGSGGHYTVHLFDLAGDGTVGIIVKGASCQGPTGLDNVASAASDTCRVHGYWTTGLVKQLGDGTEVQLDNKYLYLRQNTYGYVEEPNRVSGIRIQAAGLPTAGKIISVHGTVQTNGDGEKYILATFTPGNTVTVKPYACNMRALRTALMCGLYVKVAGRVMSKSDTSYVLQDGPSGSPLTIVCPGQPTVENHSFITVTGAAGLQKGNRVIYIQ